MTVLSLAEGEISDRDRPKFLNFLILLTGKDPVRVVEHRIYLASPVGFEQSTYIMKIHNNITGLTPQDVQESDGWKLISLGRDNPQETIFTLRSMQVHDIESANPLALLTEIGFSYDFEVVRIGYEFIHPSGIRIQIYSPFRVENQYDLSSMKQPRIAIQSHLSPISSSSQIYPSNQYIEKQNNEEIEVWTVEARRIVKTCDIEKAKASLMNILNAIIPYSKMKKQLKLRKDLYKIPPST